MAPPTKLAGAQVPLLPENSEAMEEPASVSGAVFNVTTSIIGAGIMSIPATMKVLGVVPAFFSIVFVAILVDISVDFLRSTYSGVPITYAALMKEAFGRPGSVMVQVCVLITNFGCLIMYFIIIGDVLSGKQLVDGEVHLGVLQEWFGIHWWNTRTFTLLFTAIFILLPLVLFRRVESLRHSSAISVLLAVVFVGICSVLSIYALFQGKTQSPRLIPQLDSQASFLNLFTTVPVIVTAFTFHFNVHAIGVELGKATDMTLAVRISLVLCCAIYFTIGFFGYLLFGDSTMDDILVNFDQSCGSATGFLLNDMVRLSYAFHLMLVFPLLNFSLRSNLDELFFPKKPLLATDNKRFLSLTFVVLVLSYLAAIAIPSIWYLFQFLGSTSAVCLAFIFPGAVALRDINGTFSKRDKIIAATMIILAVLTSAIAISSNVISLTGNSS